MKYLKKAMAAMLIIAMAATSCPVFGTDAGEITENTAPVGEITDAAGEIAAENVFAEAAEAAPVDMPVEEAGDMLLPAFEDPADSDAVENAADNVQAESGERFSEGYIWVAGQTPVFSDADMKDATGIFTDTAAAYAVSRIECENEAEDALYITFAASDEAVSGYIMADAILPMSEAEIGGYLAAVRNIAVTDVEGGHPLANTYFEFFAGSTPEEDAPTAEEIPAEDEAATEDTPVMEAVPEEGEATEEIPSEDEAATEDTPVMEAVPEEGEATEEIPAEDEAATEETPVAEEVPEEGEATEEIPAEDEAATEETPALEGTSSDAAAVTEGLEPPKTYLGTGDNAAAASVSGAVQNIVITSHGGVNAVREKTTLQMYAAVTPVNANVGTVYWSSSNNAVATVNNDGVVTTKAVAAESKVTIYATAADGSGAKAGFELTVMPIVKATKVVISGVTNEVAVKKSILLNAEVLAGEAPASVGEVTWKIKSGSKYASIKDKGNGAVSVTGKKAGKVTIVATSKDGAKVVSAPFTVVVKSKAASSVKIKSVNGVTCIDAAGTNRTLAFSATVSSKSASQKVSWSVDAKYANIAQIDQKGVLTVKEGAFGEVIIKATALDGSKKYGTLSVNVVDPVKTVAISADTNTVGLKKSITLKAQTSARDGDPTIPGVSWKVTSGKSYAKVSANADGSAKVTGLKGGSAVVTAYAKDGSGASASYTVYVKKKAASSVKITSATGFGFIDVGKGDSLALTAKVSPSSAGQKVAWSVDPQYHGIADVSETGVLTITGQKTGAVVVKAKALDGSGKTGSFTVYVGKPAASVSITGVNAVKIKKSIILKASLIASDGSAADGGVRWKITSGKKYASIKAYADGTVKLTGKKAGKVTLTATANDGSGAKASIRVSVKKSVSGLSIKGAKTIDLNTVGEGKTASFTLTCAGAVQWTSSDPELFAVDQNGNVTLMARKAGSAVITAVNEKGKQGAVTVKALYLVSDIDISGGIADESGIHILKGGSVRLNAAVSPANAGNTSVKWKTSSKKVATVSSSGTVKGVKAGSVTITATAADGSGVKESVRVIVHDTPSSVNISNAGAAVKNGAALYLYSAGSKLNLTASVKPSKAYQKVEWSSNNPAVAIVDAGVVTAVSEGAAKITVKTTDGKNKSSSVYVVVGKPAEQVTVSGPKEVTVGKRITLSAQALPVEAVNKKIVWKVDTAYSAYASVSNEGVVTGKKAGYAKIIATAEGQGVSGEYFVYVAPKSTKVYIYSGDTNITGKTTKVYRNLGDGTVQLSARLDPSTADQSVTWKSSNKKIATVNANGVVTAKKNGTVTITAKAKDGSKKKATAKLKITTGKMTLEIVSPDNIRTLTAGSSTQLTVSVTPAGQESAGVFWTSGDERLATVDSNGRVTAKSGVEGEVTITAACSGISATYVLEITCPPESIEIAQPAATTIDLNGSLKTLQLSASVYPAAASQNVVWASSDTGVAGVDANGLVTVVGSGEATITAKHAFDASITGSIRIRVVKLPKGLTLAASRTRLYAGESTVITASLTPADVDNKALVWTSSSPLVKVATDSDGRITAKVSKDASSVTEVTLTAATAETLDDVSAQIRMTVSGAAAVFDLSADGKTITGYNGNETVVYIPESVTKIAAGTFDGCSKVTQLIVPDDVEIETGALNGLTGMRDAQGFLVFAGHLVSYSGNAAKVTIPAGVTHIDDGAFENNTAVVGVRIPDTVKVIGKRAFAGCTSLAEMTGY